MKRFIKSLVVAGAMALMLGVPASQGVAAIKLAHFQQYPPPPPRPPICHDEMICTGVPAATGTSSAIKLSHFGG
jgi:hypothetical protein